MIRYSFSYPNLFIVLFICLSLFCTGCDLFDTDDDSGSIFGPPSSILWTKTYPLEGSSLGVSLTQCIDRNYLVAGLTSETGAYGHGKLFLMKFDQEGNEIWTRIHSDQTVDYKIKLLNDNEGNIYLVYQDSNSSGSYINKLNEDGNFEWQRNIWEFSRFEYLDIDLTEDSGFLLTGFESVQDTNYFAMRLDSECSLIWKIPKPHDGEFLAQRGIETEPGKYLVVAEHKINLHSDTNMMFISINENGMIDTTLKYSIGNNDQPKKLIVSPSGEIILGGYTSSMFSWNAFILRLSSDLNHISHIEFGDSDHNILNSMIITNTNDIIFTGIRDSRASSRSNIWIGSFTDSETINWNNYLGNTKKNYGYDVIETEENHFIVTGLYYVSDDVYNMVLTCCDNVPIF